MLYLHDVWVNWFEGEENGYNVCYYHEWRKSDKIELIDQVPLLYITSDLFDYIENGMQDLPETLLSKIYEQSFVRKGHLKENLEYVSVVTDGKDIIAFDTIGYQIPIRKSRLIPRQEQTVYELIKDKKPESFSFDYSSFEKEYSTLSMDPELVVGLTRRERQLKQILMMAMDQLKLGNNLEELRYWLTEWNPKNYPYIRDMDEKTVWSALYDGIKYGWSPSHEEFGKKIVKGQTFLEKMWEMEQEQQQDTSKL